MTRRAFLLLGGVVACSGCSRDQTPVQPHAGPPPVSATISGGPRRVGIQADFVNLADSVSGFAGLYIDSSGTTRLEVTARGSGPAMLKRLRQHYLGRPEEDRLAVVRLDTVLFDYRQLYEWKESLEAALRNTGAIAFSVHIATNTVDIFSRSADADGATLKAASKLGVPIDAVRLVRTGDASYLADLTDEFTPGIPGGAGITMGTSGTNGCTLGINVKLTSMSSTWDALTAAHCTATIGGGPDGTVFNQGGSWPTVSSAYRFGHEVEDPTWMSSGCDGSYAYCRYADVSVIGYDSNRVADSGYVAVTVKLDSMTIKWVSKDSTSLFSNGYWSDQPWEGVTLYHVGAKTGWHSGTVTESCSDWQVGEPGYSNYEWECQTVVAGIAGHGDSGGPVFSRDGGKDFLFAGLVSRFGNDTAHYVLSSFANICLDLGGCPTVQWP